MARLVEREKFQNTSPDNYFKLLEGLIPALVIIEKQITKILDLCQPSRAGRFLLTEQTLVDIIVSAVLSYYNIEIEELKGRHRKEHKVFARQIICKLSNEFTKMTWTEIGHIIGKDHATAMYSVDQVDDSVDTNGELALDYLYIKEEIEPLIITIKKDYLTKTVKLLKKIHDERSKRSK